LNAPHLSPELVDARREARVEATVFVAAALGVLVLLAVVSLQADWELVGLRGWVWLILCIPEALLIGGLVANSRVSDHRRGHRLLWLFITLVVVGNLVGLFVLIAALLTEDTAELSGAQLLVSGAAVWLTNLVVFGLTFWMLDGGGPVERATSGRGTPDFLFPQDATPERAPSGWYPRLEDYVYIALTNGIAFSPTDAMPLTRRAKASMAVDSIVSIAVVLLVAARAVNVLGS
jgi:uncharacterized membrane protein